MPEISCVFVDTNVLLNVLWRRKGSSVRMLESLKLRKIPIYTFYLTVLELIDKEQGYIFAHKLPLDRQTLETKGPVSLDISFTFSNTTIVHQVDLSVVDMVISNSTTVYANP